MAASAALTCHVCGSDQLSLLEYVEHTSLWDEGLDLVDGVIRPRGEAIHNPGGPTRKPTIHCEGCDRYWTPRRRIEFP